MSSKRKKNTLYNEMSFKEKSIMWLLIAGEVLEPILLPIIAIVCIILIVVTLIMIGGFKTYRMVFPLG